MKKLISIIITILIIILVFKVMAILIPFIVIAGVVLWLYSRYKIKKAIKNYNENFSQPHTFADQQQYTEKKEEAHQEEFNGPIIDVDYEDVKKD